MGKLRCQEVQSFGASLSSAQSAEYQLLDEISGLKCSKSISDRQKKATLGNVSVHSTCTVQAKDGMEILFSVA